MPDVDPSTPLGIALIVVGAIVALKAARTAVKLAMVVVILAGLYLWFGDPGLLATLR